VPNAWSKSAVIVRELIVSASGGRDGFMPDGLIIAHDGERFQRHVAPAHGPLVVLLVLLAVFRKEPLSAPIRMVLTDQDRRTHSSAGWLPLNWPKIRKIQQIGDRLHGGGRTADTISNGTRWCGFSGPICFVSAMVACNHGREIEIPARREPG